MNSNSNAALFKMVGSLSDKHTTGSGNDEK
jgi:hypothetical protein